MFDDDDWGSGATSTTSNVFSNQGERGFSSGGGKPNAGRGRGRFASSSSSSGFGATNGFGGHSRFDNHNTIDNLSSKNGTGASNDDDAWAPKSGGFGISNGFSGSGGFDSNSGGFGDSKPRGKGFGGNNFGEKGRFKGGEEGHMARECPNNKSDGGENNDRPPLYIPPPPPEDDDAIYGSMQKGINFGKYDSIPVEVTGVNPPRCIDSFDAADLPQHIRSNVAKAKYEKPTPVQKYSIPIITSGRDLMACAQTGSGKTAAFLLPVLASLIRNGLESSSFSEKQLPQAIVVGPTRELVYQIYLEARKFARGSICRPVVAYGGTSVGYQLRELQRGCNVLIATPGRLMDFINKGKVGLDKVQYLILDEADRMLDMGFETEIRKLADSPGMPLKTERHTLMFSATFPDEIQKLAHDFLREDFLFLTVGRVGGACSDVTQTIIQVDQGDKRSKLLELVANVNETRSRTLVFVETKRSADFLACSLSQDSYPTTSIHGDRLQREREEALRDFKAGTHPILIATSVAARGLDIPKVEHVVNYDLPQEIDEYVHRIGRTGRCGNLGQATSFYDNSKDAQLARSLVKVLSEAMQEVPPWLEGCAESAVGSSFGADRGEFGGRDARRGGRRAKQNQGFGGGNDDFGSRSTGDYDYNDGGGFDGRSAAQNNGPSGFGDDEDDWD
ncbi:putative ATP-dependent RNA helicase DDX4 [Clavelina lepadiformis]|uniref:putative ATP-dependent RNA helicase DDX4 n=1 Tax=Clavelina lepadiformis TaxID=159417 RepID=UPI004041C439